MRFINLTRTAQVLLGLVAVITLVLPARAQSCTPAWSAVPTTTVGANNTVRCFTSFNDGTGAALYAAGNFTTIGGVPANRVAKWNGTTWSALGNGFPNGQVFALAVYDDGSGSKLYAAGSFTVAGGSPADYIARWNGSAWVGVGGGTNGQVSALLVFDDDGPGPHAPVLVAGGAFGSAGNIPANRVARWNGSSWSNLHAGVGNGDGSSHVDCLAVFNGELYAGGSFINAGCQAAAAIARWNGSAWTQAGQGLVSGVSALAVWDDGQGGGPALYAGGAFQNSVGNAPANRIAKFDGSSWSPLGGDLNNGLNQTVFTLAVFDDGSGGGPALYAAGNFSAPSSGAFTISRVAKWNGTSWSALSNGPFNGLASSSAFALCVFNDGTGAGATLYAGGAFTTAGDVTVNRIARWRCP